MLKATTRREPALIAALLTCAFALAYALAFASPAYAATADGTAPGGSATVTAADDGTKASANDAVPGAADGAATKGAASEPTTPAADPKTDEAGGTGANAGGETTPVDTPAQQPVDTPDQKTDPVTQAPDTTEKPASDTTTQPKGTANTEKETTSQTTAKPSTTKTTASTTKPSTTKAATTTTKTTSKTATSTTVKAQSTAKTAAKTAAKTTTASKMTAQATQANTGLGDLAAGTYYIVSAMSGSQVLDVAGASKNKGTGIITWFVNGDANERWNVTINKAGYAIIKSVSSGLVLDISGASARNGNHVIQWAAKTSGDSRNQQWIITKEGSFYQICSRLNMNYVIDLTGNTAKNGTAVEIWESNGGTNQLFSFVAATPKKATAGKQTIRDGVYSIDSKAATGRSVNITSGSRKDGANADIYTKNNTAQESFYFKYDGKGFYTVTNMNSGKKLMVSKPCSVSGINVAQYDAGNVDLAKWKVISLGNGQYRLVNKATNTSLNVAGGKNANGTNVQSWYTKNITSQKFGLTKRVLLPTGAVVIEVGANTGLALDVYNSSTKANAAIGTYKDSNSFNQRLYVAKQGKGYTLRPFNSRLYLTASNGKLVQKTKQKNFANQIWTASETEDGFLMLTNLSTNLALTIAGTPTKAQSTINLKTAMESTPQKFFAKGVKIFEDGTYYIAAATATSISNQVVDVAGGKRINATNVEIYKKNGNNNQKFNITSVGKGYYKITSVASGRAIDISGASKKSGANVIIWSDKGTTNQKWKIVFNDDFTMSFVSANNPKLRLDMAGASTKNGTNIQVYTANTSNAQKFWLEQTTPNVEVVQIGVPCYMQNPELPTGCESVALTNALRYWGFSLSKTEIADNWMPYGTDGVYDFTGNPRDSSGWIICAPGITNTANDYLKAHDSDVRAYNKRGTSLKDLRKYIDEGTPVVVWTSIGMATPNYAYSKHGYPICSNNHAVVLTGYNPNNNTYQVADSLAGTVWRNGSAFESIYNTMGKQAVILTN